MACLPPLLPESSGDETEIHVRKWCRALTIVMVVPVESEVLTVVPHDKTRVCYTERVFFVDMILISGLSVVHWASGRHQSTWREKALFYQGKLFHFLSPIIAPY